MDFLWTFHVWEIAIDFAKLDSNKNIIFIAKHPRSEKGQSHYHCILWTDSLNPKTVNKRLREMLKTEFAIKGGGLGGAQVKNEEQLLTYCLRHQKHIDKFPSAIYKLKTDRWTDSQIEQFITNSQLKNTDIYEQTSQIKDKNNNMLIIVKPKAKKLALYTECRLTAEAIREGNPKHTETPEQIAAIVVGVLREDNGRPQPRADILKSIVAGLWCQINKNSQKVKDYDENLIHHISKIDL